MRDLVKMSKKRQLGSTHTSSSLSVQHQVSIYGTDSIFPFSIEIEENKHFLFKQS